MAGGTRDRWNLFLCSFTILFIELVCIRWIPAYIRYLGYFTNFVLLGSFLGIGLGILQARRRLDLHTFFPVALAVLVWVVSTFKLQLTINSSQEVFFCRPLMPGEVQWDTQTCSSSVYTDKGHLTTGTSLYPPRADVTMHQGLDDPAVATYNQLYGMDAIILRYFNPYGPNELHRPETHAIPNFITAALEQRPIPLYWKGQGVRDFIYIEDLARAHTALLSLTHQHTLTRIPEHVSKLLTPIPDPVRL